MHTTSGGSFRANVEPGSVIITDGLEHDKTACSTALTHEPFTVKGSGVPADVPQPGVHRVASLLKRWLLSTHQDAVGAEPLQAYMDEFSFRFNWRSSGKCGMLFYRLLERAVQAPPITENRLLMPNLPEAANPTPRTSQLSHSSTLELRLRPRPWPRGFTVNKELGRVR